MRIVSIAVVLALAGAVHQEQAPAPHPGLERIAPRAIDWAAVRLQALYGGDAAELGVRVEFRVDDAAPDPVLLIRAYVAEEQRGAQDELDVDREAIDLLMGFERKAMRMPWLAWRTEFVFF